MIKKFFLLSLLGLGAAQGQTLVNLLQLPTKCTVGTPGIVVFTGTTFLCALFGQGLSLSGASVTSTAAPSAPWAVETVSLANVSSTATSFIYTPKNVPLVNGVLLFWYISGGLPSPMPGVALLGGPTITFNLPANWSSVDTISIAYQY